MSKVLIVDDERDLVSGIEFNLRQAGLVQLQMRRLSHALLVQLPGQRGRHAKLWIAAMGQQGQLRALMIVLSAGQ